MRRISIVALAIAMLTTTVGCDEWFKTDKNKAEEKAATDKATADKAAADKAATKGTGDTPSPADKPQPKKPHDFVDFPTTDPLISNAIENRNQLVAQEEELLQRLDDIRTLLISAKSDPSKMRQSIEEFISLTKEIRGVVVQAGESLSKLEETSNDLARSMKHLGSSYRATAGLFRAKARDYTEKKLREQLLGFADDFEAIAKTIPERMKSLQTFQKSLPKLKLKIRESSAFLDDVVSFLSSHPGLGADSRERYTSQFETFMSTFSELVRTLEEFRSTFRETAFSKAVQDAVRKEVLAREKAEAARREEVARAEKPAQREIVIDGNSATSSGTATSNEAQPEAAHTTYYPVSYQQPTNYNTISYQQPVTYYSCACSCNSSPQGPPVMYYPSTTYVVSSRPQRFPVLSTLFSSR